MAESSLSGFLNQKEKSRFWRRQISAAPTRVQIGFDLLFGAVAPVLCFAFDPIVFTRGGMLADYQAVVYLISGVEIVVLIAWLICGHQLRLTTSVFGGILLGGACVSGVVGIAILPFSLLGLFFYFIGIFGFIPFVTSFVYYRNARRALQLGHRYSIENRRMAGALLGFVLAFGAPIGLSYAASGLVSASVNVVLFADPANADLAADRLRYLTFISSNNLDRLVWAYEGETESSRKEELKRRYKRITGNDIEARLQLLKD